MLTHFRTLASLNTLIIFCAVLPGTAAATECTPEQQVQATRFIKSAARATDQIERSLLLGQSVKACESFETWFRYGDAEFKLDNWAGSSSALERARNLLHADNESGMSKRQIELLAVGNALLAESYFRENRLAQAMVTMEDARSGYSVINKPPPERLIILQANIDDSLANSDAAVLARSFQIQQERATRGLGVRPKLRELPPEEDISTAQTSAIVALYEGTAAETPTPPATAPEASEAEVSTPVTESRINIPVLFAYDSFDLEPGSLNTVRQIAGALTILGLDDSATVRVVGHTDSQGSASYNKQLSERRAEAVLLQIKALLSAPVKFESIGKGETALRYHGSGDNDHRRNRRVEIVVVQ